MLHVNKNGGNKEERQKNRSRTDENVEGWCTLWTTCATTTRKNRLRYTVTIAEKLVLPFRILKRGSHP